jgi:hypothetical protein
MTDCDNTRLKKAVAEIVKGLDSPEEAALKIFKFVRDKIPFNATLDIYLKASQAFQRKTIDYCNKINIHVSLLRAIGIPSRFHMVRVKKEVLEHIVPGFLYSHLPSPVGHLWCECNLSGRWTVCEALYDRPFYEGMLKSGWITKEQIPTIDWDGKSDLLLMQHWLVADNRTFSHYEEVVGFAGEEGMPPKFFCKTLEWLPAFFSNKRTEKVRGL